MTLTPGDRDRIIAAAYRATTPAELEASATALEKLLAVDPTDGEALGCAELIEMQRLPVPDMPEDPFARPFPDLDEVTLRAGFAV